MLWNSSFEYMAYTGRYESKSHELPVAFDDCSDKEAFIEDCKVVQLLLICFLPKMVGRFHWLGLSLDWIVVIFPSPLSMTKNKNQVNSIQRRPLKKAAKLTESFTGSKSSVSRWLQSSSIICSFLQLFAILCNQLIETVMKWCAINLMIETIGNDRQAITSNSLHQKVVTVLQLQEWETIYPEFLSGRRHGPGRAGVRGGVRQDDGRGDRRPDQARPSCSLSNARRKGWMFQGQSISIIIIMPAQSLSSNRSSAFLQRQRHKCICLCKNIWRTPSKSCQDTYNLRDIWSEWWWHMFGLTNKKTMTKT